MATREEIESILNDPALSLEDKAVCIVILKGYPESGMSFCCHHDVLVEHCSDFLERTIVILSTKPVDQHATRFLNFTHIPNEFLSSELNKARTELNKVEAELNKVEAELDKAYAERNSAGFNRAVWNSVERIKARVELNEAYAGWIKASAEWLSQTDLPALFNKLAPENTWNGKNIGWEK